MMCPFNWFGKDLSHLFGAKYKKRIQRELGSIQTCFQLLNLRKWNNQDGSQESITVLTLRHDIDASVTEAPKSSCQFFHMFQWFIDGISYSKDGVLIWQLKKALASLSSHNKRRQNKLAWCEESMTYLHSMLLCNRKCGYMRSESSSFAQAFCMFKSSALLIVSNGHLQWNLGMRSEITLIVQPAFVCLQCLCKMLLRACSAMASTNFGLQFWKRGTSVIDDFLGSFGSTWQVWHMTYLGWMDEFHSRRHAKHHDQCVSIWMMQSQCHQVLANT